MITVRRSAGFVSLLASGLVLSGCGMPGAPLPPSLHLPDPVTDLTAIRTGDQVQLNWTMSKKDTDKLLLAGSVPVRVCRKEDGATVCAQAGELNLPAGGEGVFTETLPQQFAAGSRADLPILLNSGIATAARQAVKWRNGNRRPGAGFS